MGGGNSKEGFNPGGKSDAELINSFLPVFFTDSPLDEDTELQFAKNLWKMIADDTAPGYVKLKESSGVDAPTAIYFFYVSFYDRLFDVHPSCKPLFKKGIKQQGMYVPLSLYYH